MVSIGYPGAVLYARAVAVAWPYSTASVQNRPVAGLDREEANSYPLRKSRLRPRHVAQLVHTEGRGRGSIRAGPACNQGQGGRVSTAPPAVCARACVSYAENRLVLHTHMYV